MAKPRGIVLTSFAKRNGLCMYVYTGGIYIHVYCIMQWIRTLG